MADPVDALQKRMAVLGLNQKGMGLRLGISQSTMSRIIARDLVPSFTVQLRLEKKDGIKVEWWPDPRAEFLRKRRQSA
jgi:plasmid maintenance system antidote protein VapI